MFPCCLSNAAKNQVCLHDGDVMCLEIQFEYEDYKSWKKCVCECEMTRINEIHNYSMNIQLNDITNISESRVVMERSILGMQSFVINCKDKFAMYSFT